jgi:hypothetical protein
MSNPSEDLPIDCVELPSGKTRCLWRDDNNQEHAFYYSKEQEYIYFNSTARHWLALLKPSSPASPVVDGRSRKAFAISENRSSIAPIANQEFKSITYIIQGENRKFIVPPDVLDPIYNDLTQYTQQGDGNGTIYVLPIPQQVPTGS